MTFQIKPTDIQKHPKVADWYNQYLQSPKWIRKKEKLFARTGKYCKKCASEEQLKVHHKTYERVTQERMNDLVVLCNTCHSKIDHHKIPYIQVIYIEDIGLIEDAWMALKLD